MNPSKKLTHVVAVVAAATAFGAGCGDDKKADTNATSAPAANTASSDADAKRAAREFETELEVCFSDAGIYAACTKSKGDVSATTTDSGYVVTAKSKSGNAFAIAKVDGAAPVRTCVTPGNGGC